MESIISILARELGRDAAHVENVVRLIDEGNTIPFIARYRKELHGAMDDTSPGWRKKSIAVFFTECWNFSFFHGIMIKKAGQRHLIFGQSHIAE